MNTARCDILMHTKEQSFLSKTMVEERAHLSRLTKNEIVAAHHITESHDHERRHPVCLMGSGGAVRKQ